MEQRQIKGMEIVKTLGKYIKKTEGGWTVPSQSSNDVYKVNEEFVCTCPDCQTRNVTCKHAFAAIKKKFGDGLKSKNRTAQINELLCKVIAYNMTVVIHEMNELGISPDFCSGSPTPAQNVG